MLCTNVTGAGGARLGAVGDAVACGRAREARAGRHERRSHRLCAAAVRCCCSNNATIQAAH